MTTNDRPAIINDRYQLSKRIGGGGMADVYLGLDLLLERRVAVKVLFPEFATDPSFVARFRREAQAAANLTHPNIVGVYDWGQQGGTHFLVIEYVNGRTVTDVLRTEHKLPATQAAQMASEVAAALGFAHRSGMVHRDVKPGNIFVTGNGDVKLADFGIVRVANDDTDDDLIQSDPVTGTAAYISPEQAQGANPDPRSDLYSLGVVMYEMVAGRPPFEGDSPVAIAYKQVHDHPKPLRQVVSEVPLPYEAIVEKLLAKDPRVRYESGDDLRDDLRRFLNGDQVLALAVTSGHLEPSQASPGSSPQDRALPGSRRRQPARVRPPATSPTPAEPMAPKPKMRPTKSTLPGSVFLSYSRRDVKQMRKVRTAVEKAGLGVWTDEHLEPGTPSWTKAIEIAIDGASALVVMLSPDAKQSTWVEIELNYARTRGVPIYPVLLRGDDATAVPMILISYQYVDARANWTQAVDRLVGRLRAR